MRNLSHISGFKFGEAKAPLNEGAKVHYLFGLTILFITICFWAF